MVQELGRLTKSRDEAEQNIKEVKLEIDHMQQKIKGLQKMLVTPPAWEETKEYADWLTKIEAMQKGLYAAGHEADAQIQGLQAKLAPVESEINEIQREQADAELIKRQDARIAELKGQQKKLGISLAQLDSMIHLAELFVQLKAADVEAEVNGSFHTVRWKLFEMQVNGGVKACCEAQVDGKDYGSLSKSEKVNAGLDIVDTLGRKMGLVMPVWHDDAESVCHPMKIAAQTISLYVSDKDKALRTEETV
jgi:5-bromo-4-chloroindolyl phosphate hydrolysis protein